MSETARIIRVVQIEPRVSTRPGPVLTTPPGFSRCVVCSALELTPGRCCWIVCAECQATIHDAETLAAVPDGLAEEMRWRLLRGAMKLPYDATFEQILEAASQWKR